MRYTQEQLAKIKAIAAAGTRAPIDPDPVGRDRWVTLSNWKDKRIYIIVHKEGRRTEDDGYIDLKSGALVPGSSTESALYCLKGFNL